MFWFSGADNNELAENLASFLLSKTHLIDHILDFHSSSRDAAEQYAAVLSAARGNLDSIPAETIITCAEKAAGSDNPALLRAAGLLLSKAAVNENQQIRKYIDSLEKEGGKNAEALLAEIMK